MKPMWEARAEYADGTEVSKLFPYSEYTTEEVQQHRLESWLIDRHPDCTWYSVNYIEIEEN